MFVVGVFELRGVAGRGGMGEVWEGVHRVGGAPVAVKVLTAERARDLRAAAAFEREVRTTAALSSPHVVRVHEYGRVSLDEARGSKGLLPTGSPYLVMDWAPGGTALPWIGRADWPFVRRILQGVLAGLAHAHARGVVHLDVKPTNTLLGPGDVVRLADFGVARAIGEPGGRVAGTPAFMAPEQLGGDSRDLGPWTDLYAVGQLAFTLVSGRTAYVADTASGWLRAHRSGAIPPLGADGRVPDGFDDWVRTLTAPDPGARYPCAPDAAHALASLGDAFGAPARTAAPARSDATTIAWATMELPAVEAAPAASAAPPRARAPLPDRWPGLRADAMAPGLGQGLVGLRDAPLVGRDDLRDRLWAALREAASAEARAVVLTGPGGIGKTRLARALVEAAREVADVAALWASSDAGGADGGVARMILEHLRARGLPHDGVRKRIEAYVGASGDAAARWVVEPLAELLAPSGRALFVDPARSASAFVALEARRRPTIVVVDDARPGPALEVVRHLLGGRGLLCVLTVRDEALAEPGVAAAVDALVAAGAERIAVPPLAEHEEVELVHGLLGVDDALVARVRERTAGNPLFAVHLVGDWVERGLLEDGPAGLELAPDADPGVPEPIQALWRRRLAAAFADQPLASQALEVAAVLGAPVSFAEWEAAVADLGVTPDAVLDAAFRAGLAVRADAAQQAFQLAHRLLAETLLAQAADQWRLRSHHRRCAQVVARDAAGWRQQARLGHHRLRAGEAGQAVAPLLEAAAATVRMGLPLEADPILLDLTDAIEAAGLDPAAPERIRTHLARAGLERMRRTPAVWVHADRAAELAELGGRPDLVAEARMMQGLAASDVGPFEQAGPLLADACERFRALGDARGLARAQVRLGFDLLRRRRSDDAIACFEASRDAFLADGDTLGAAMPLRGLGEALTYRDPARSRACMDQALRGYQEHGHVGGTFDCLVNVGYAAQLAGDLDAAEARYQEALELARSARWPSFFAEVNLAALDVRRGRVEPALARLVPLLRRVLGDDVRELMVRVTIAPCRAEGTNEEWRENLDRLTVLLERTGLVHPGTVDVMELAAQRALAAGHADRAREARHVADDQRARMPIEA